MAQRRTLAAPRIPWALALGLVTLLARPTFCPAESVKCTGGVKVVPRERLFVSEPNPEWFGNGPNPDVPETQNWTNANWLKSRFHFNFAEYSHGPSNFGVLRVMNDDLVQPRRGFGSHPHRDMEILTFILQGNLTHKDSTGTQEILGRGSLQYMTAGSGVLHSEQNLHDEPLRFIQCWVLPRQRGLNPRYGSMTGDALAKASRVNQWSHIVSDVSAQAQTPVKIHQDCNVYMSEFNSETVGSERSERPELLLNPGRQGYLLCAEGSVQISDSLGEQHELRQHDAAELKGSLKLKPTPKSRTALLILFEMKDTSDLSGN